MSHKKLFKIDSVYIKYLCFKYKIMNIIYMPNNKLNIVKLSFSLTAKH